MLCYLEPKSNKNDKNLKN